MPYGGHRDRLVLADLTQFGDLREARERVRDEIQRAGGGAPVQRYEGADPSGTVRVVVDPRGRVTGVDISRNWQRYLAPEAVAEALFRSYSAALQRAMTGAALTALAGAGQRRDRSIDDPGNPEPADQPDDRTWLNRIWATLDEGRTRLDRLARMPAEFPEERELTSPNGCFTARTAGRTVTGVTGNGRRIAACGVATLREEALAVLQVAADQPSGTR